MDKNEECIITQYQNHVVDRLQSMELLPAVPDGNRILEKNFDEENFILPFCFSLSFDSKARLKRCWKNNLFGLLMQILLERMLGNYVPRFLRRISALRFEAVPDLVFDSVSSDEPNEDLSTSNWRSKQ